MQDVEIKVKEDILKSLDQRISIICETISKLQSEIEQSEKNIEQLVRAKRFVVELSYDGFAVPRQEALDCLKSLLDGGVLD